MIYAILYPLLKSQTSSVTGMPNDFEQCLSEVYQGKVCFNDFFVLFQATVSRDYAVKNNVYNV